MAEVEFVVLSYCSMCHSQEPQWPGMAVAPKGVILETQEQIRRHATPIALQAVYTHAMPPPGSYIEMEEEDRQLLAVWIDAGAPGW